MTEREAVPARRRLRVGVLFGGRSGEHQVSLHSAQAVMHALEQAGHEVVPIGITPSGRWLVSGNPMLALTSGTPSGERMATMLPEPGHRGLMPLTSQERANGTTATPIRDRRAQDGASEASLDV